MAKLRNPPPPPPPNEVNYLIKVIAKLSLYAGILMAGFCYIECGKLWNEEPPRKLNPNKKLFCSAIKSALLSTIIV